MTVAQHAAEPAAELEALRAENRRLRAKLVAAAPMATLGELSGTATHEFNNVLMTILNYAQLGMRNRDDASRDKALSKIHDAARRAADITGSLLGQSRSRTDNHAAVSLSELVDRTLVLLGKEMQKYRVMVEVDHAGDVPAALASSNQIQRVLINLMINARQAMPDGGTLSIRTAASSDGGVELTVRDSGQGIAPEVLPRIFDAFFSTKDGPDASGCGGTGLGLAACKEIVDAHGGRIRVESTPGRGTAFIIRLRPADASAAKVA